MSVLAKLKSASSLNDLAALLGYRPSGIAYIIYKLPDENKYKEFQIPKSGGGYREIRAPIEPLKTLQRRLTNVLYACRDEIERDDERRPLSHGFRRNLSIVTNARRHKRKRYVLNLDIQDFFPTFNFGRVRGYFIRNQHFQLNEKVATIIDQIACFDNGLPQGSPCSPIIADLIAHVLDVRLVQLAKRHKLTYSRYADDLTFSTSQLRFPSAIAEPPAEGSAQWNLGYELVNEINESGFAINPDKTRMQYRMSRQLVTGLTVNSKVNIRPEYYRLTRAMCDNLFKTGFYFRPKTMAIPYHHANDDEFDPEDLSNLNPLEGILNHIHYVKDLNDDREEFYKKKNPTTARRLYARFLKYKYFVALERPLIIAKGRQTILTSSMPYGH